MKAFFHKYFAIVAPLLLGLLLILDQGTKALAVLHLKGNVPFVIWDGVLELYYFENTGAAWGILQNKQIFFYILTIIFSAVLLFEIYRLRRDIKFLPFNYTLVMMLAGAIGNFIDRLLNQYVVDFIYFKLIDFPIFNVADCYITVAVVILMLLILFFYNDAEFEQIIPWFGDHKAKEQE